MMKKIDFTKIPVFKVKNALEYFERATDTIYILQKRKGTNDFLDTEWLNNNYNIYNGMLFDNELPDVDFAIYEAEGGVYGKAYDCAGSNYCIAMNNKHDCLEAEWHLILIHEMIHIWEYVNFRKAGHGANFKRKMNEINRNFGIDVSTTIKVRYKSTD